MVVHLGAVGERITLETEQDLTEATKMEIQVIKPDGTSATWTAIAEDTSLLYVSQAGDLDVAGRYLLISYVEWGSGSKHLGDGFVLPVYPKTYQASSYTAQPATRKIDAVRLLIGKSRALNLITDDEIDYQLSRANGNEILAAAYSAEQIAAWWTDKVDKSMGGSSVSMSQKSKQWQELADNLRSRAMHTSITPRASSSAGRENLKFSVGRDDFLPGSYISPDSGTW